MTDSFQTSAISKPHDDDTCSRVVTAFEPIDDTKTAAAASTGHSTSRMIGLKSKTSSVPIPSSPLRTKKNESIRDVLLKTNPDVDTQRKRPEPPREKWTVLEAPQKCGIVETLAVSLWLGWMGFLVYAIIGLTILGSPRAWSVFIGLCTVSLVLPRDFPAGHGKRIGDWLMKQGESYFGLKTVVEDADEIEALTELNRAAIFAFEPHDVLPYTVFAFNTGLGRIPGEILSNCRCLMTSAVFYIPFLRQIYSWTGGSPVDRKTFRGKLDRKESFVFCPGGVQEVTLMDQSKPDDLILYLQSRKGFIKQALATGSPIIPAFGFNTDGSYGYWIPRGRIITRLARSIGFLPLFFWGRFGLPFGIPRTQNAHVVIGRPIYVPLEGDEVKDESIEKYHALFLEKIEALFERHKKDAGYGHRSLKIL